MTSSAVSIMIPAPGVPKGRWHAAPPLRCRHSSCLKNGNNCASSSASPPASAQRASAVMCGRMVLSRYAGPLLSRLRRPKSRAR